MTLGDRVGLSDAQERLLTRVLQFAMVVLATAGAVTTRWGTVLLVAIGLGVTLLPALLRREYGYAMEPGLVLWITVAMILHTIGSLGLYGTVGWYDEITHTASSTLVAGLGYAAFRALEVHSAEVDVPPAFRGLFIVVFVLAAGMLWECIEYAGGSMIPVYGVDDIVTDFVFNAVGATIVALWGTGYLRGLVGFFTDRLETG